MEDNLDALRPFVLKVSMHMPGNTFTKLPFAFPHANLKSWKSIQSHAARLSGFEPEASDCCVSSCIAYTGVYESETACPFCEEPRRDSSGHVRQQFIYLPIHQQNVRLTWRLSATY